MKLFNTNMVIFYQPGYNHITDKKTIKIRSILRRKIIVLIEKEKTTSHFYKQRS